MAPEIYIGLLHYPVLDKEGKIITTAVTNLDLHDLARLGRTYDIKAYYVIQPLPLQKRLAQRLMDYWLHGRGGEYNVTRQQAFELVRLTDTLEQAVQEIEAERGSRPQVVMTTAKARPEAVSYAGLRETMAPGGTWFILFGTGWGIDPEFMRQNSDYVLAPIETGSGYNHLSVRMAAAIILDRLLGGG